MNASVTDLIIINLQEVCAYAVDEINAAIARRLVGVVDEETESIVLQARAARKQIRYTLRTSVRATIARVPARTAVRAAAAEKELRRVLAKLLLEIPQWKTRTSARALRALRRRKEFERRHPNRPQNPVHVPEPVQKSRSKLTKAELRERQNIRSKRNYHNMTPERLLEYREKQKVRRDQARELRKFLRGKSSEVQKQYEQHRDGTDPTADA